MKACFATNGFNGKIDCREWARETNTKSLKQHGGSHMYRPKNCKKCGGRKMQQGGLNLYTTSNTAAGATTPTGQNNAARLSDAQIKQLATQFGFRTDSNRNLQQDLFDYANQNQPAAIQSVMNKYGQTGSGTFVDDMLGARTADLLQMLQIPARPPVPAQAKLTENLYGPNQVLLGMASQRYRDQQDITDPGVIPPEYVDYQQFKPNTSTFTGPRYKIPYDTYLNQITRGTSTIQNPDDVAPYMILPDAARQMILNKGDNSMMNVAGKKKGGYKMKGGRLVKAQLGGRPSQQDYPDYESWLAAVDEWEAQNSPQATPMNLRESLGVNQMDIGEDLAPPDQPQGIVNPVTDAMNREIIQDPNYYVNGPGANQQYPQTARRNPYQTLQNVGLGLKTARTVLGEISGRVERGRQNKYDYMQQTALGQMNPMQSSDFQPNPYNLYMQYGGNLTSLIRDYDQWTNDAQFDFGSGDNDKGFMKKGGYEIDRMLVVRKFLPQLLKFGSLGTSKYRNYQKGGEHEAMESFHNLQPDQYEMMLQLIQNNPMEGFHMMPDGTMMSNSQMDYKKGGIHIKKENRGKFTSYCGGKVTDECIQRGLNSSNPTTRKRANFARNARKWN